MTDSDKLLAAVENLSKLKIPIQIGFLRCDISTESARLLLAALDDYFDGDLPPDLAALRDILSPF
jgi:hypothetical protein